MKFTEEYVMCTEKHILVKKLFANKSKMGLQLEAWVKKKVHGVETHWLSGKEKVPATAVCKEGHVDSVLGHERTDQY